MPGRIDTTGVTPAYYKQAFATVQFTGVSGDTYLRPFVSEGLRIGIGQYLSGTCAANNRFYAVQVNGPCIGAANYYGDDSDLRVSFVSGNANAALSSFTFYAPTQEQADANAAIFQSTLPPSAAFLSFLLTTGASAVINMTAYIPPSPPSPPSPPRDKRAWIVPTAVCVSLFLAALFGAAVFLFREKRQPPRRFGTCSAKIEPTIVM
jgi:hypothetical protein